MPSTSTFPERDSAPMAGVDALLDICPITIPFLRSGYLDSAMPSIYSSSVCVWTSINGEPINENQLVHKPDYCDPSSL